MKKTNLFCFALFITVAGSAQTTIKAQQKVAGAAQVQNQSEVVKGNVSGGAAGAGIVQTDAGTKLKHRTDAEIANKKEAISSGKEKIDNKSKTTTEALTSQEISANASAHSSTRVNAKENQAQVNAKGSFSTGTAVSLNQANEQALAVKKDMATDLENKTNATLKKTTEVTTATNTKIAGTIQQTGAAAAGSTGKVVTAAKVKPAPIRVTTQVKSAAGIHLR